MPNATSQQFTTSFTTLTTFTTLTSSYVTMFETTSTATAWGGGVTVAPRSMVGGHCGLHVANVYGAVAGDTMTIAFTATYPVTLYVSSSQSVVDYGAAILRYQQNPYQYPDPCTFAPAHVFEIAQVTSGSPSIAIPTTDEYILLFFNFDITNTAIVSLMVYLGHRSTVPESVTTTQTSTYYQTFSTILETPFLSTNASLIVTGILAILVIVVSIVAFRRWKRSGKRLHESRDRKRSAG
jgi:hypothetical protein